MVSGFVIKSSIHSELILWLKSWGPISFFYVISQYHLLIRLTFTSKYSWLPCQISVDWLCKILFWAFNLVHWSRFLFLCQCDTVLMTTALWYSLISGSMMPPDLSFFFRIALAIRGHFHSTRTLGFFFYICEKSHWNFARDCIEYIDGLG